jgi:hypothetical protein
MGLLKVLGVSVGVIILCIGGVLIAARFADGPWEIIAGGPFTSGESYSGPEPDWSFVRELPTVEFQLIDPARSRTTWVLEHEGRIYIPCGYMTTTWGRIWKQWPIEAEKDGRAILRVDGKLYDRQLVRIKSGPVIEPVTQELRRKYNARPTVESVTSDYLWIFELAPGN